MKSPCHELLTSGTRLKVCRTQILSLGVYRRISLSCQCCCFDDENVDGEFDTCAFLLEPGIEFLPEIDEFIHIAVDRQAVVRYSPLGLCQPLGNKRERHTLYIDNELASPSCPLELTPIMRSFSPFGLTQSLSFESANRHASFEY